MSVPIVSFRIVSTTAVRRVPHAVHVDISTMSTANLGAGDFEDAVFLWDFDATNALAAHDTWPDPRSRGGTIDLTKDQRGFAATHVYRESNTFTIRCTCINKNLEVGTAEQQVTINADNRTAIHVAAAGNDTTGDGSQATPYKTFAKALSVAADNSKILLNRGDTFDITAHSLSQDNLLITAYGAAQARPILRNTVTATDQFVPTGENIVFDDVDYDGNSITGSNTGVVIYKPTGACKNFCVSRQKLSSGDFLRRCFNSTDQETDGASMYMCDALQLRLERFFHAPNGKCQNLIGVSLAMPQLECALRTGISAGVMDGMTWFGVYEKQQPWSEPQKEAFRIQTAKWVYCGRSKLDGAWGFSHELGVAQHVRVEACEHIDAQNETGSSITFLGGSRGVCFASCYLQAAVGPLVGTRDHKDADPVGNNLDIKNIRFKHCTFRRTQIGVPGLILSGGQGDFQGPYDWSLAAIEIDDCLFIAPTDYNRRWITSQTSYFASLKRPMFSFVSDSFPYVDISGQKTLSQLNALAFVDEANHETGLQSIAAPSYRPDPTAHPLTTTRGIVATGSYYDYHGHDWVSAEHYIGCSGKDLGDDPSPPPGEPPPEPPPPTGTKYLLVRLA